MAVEKNSHCLEYQKHSKHSNLRKESDKDMFSWCELKPVAGMGTVCLGSLWEDSPLVLALALILLQLISFNTLNWWKHSCGQHWLADKLNLLTAWPDHHQAPACRGPARACCAQPSPPSKMHRQLPSSILPNSPRRITELWCFLWPKASWQVTWPQKKKNTWLLP